MHCFSKYEILCPTEIYFHPSLYSLTLMPMDYNSKCSQKLSGHEVIQSKVKPKRCICLGKANL